MILLYDTNLQIHFHLQFCVSAEVLYGQIFLDQPLPQPESVKWIKGTTVCDVITHEKHNNRNQCLKLSSVIRAISGKHAAFPDLHAIRMEWFKVGVVFTSRASPHHDNTDLGSHSGALWTYTSKLDTTTRFCSVFSKGGSIRYFCTAYLFPTVNSWTPKIT